MTRETKIGLLVGLAFIIVIGILLSDHLSSQNEPPQAPLGQVRNAVMWSMRTPGNSQIPATPPAAPPAVAPVQPVPTSNETTIPRPAPQPEVRIAIGAGAPEREHAEHVERREETRPLPVDPEPRHTETARTETPDTHRTAGRNGADGHGLDSVARAMGEEIVPASRNGTNASGGARLTANEYRAQPGDNLSKLAAKLPGGNTKANRDAIVKLNPSLQTNPDFIVAGRTYLLPTGGTSPAPTPTPVVLPAPSRSVTPVATPGATPAPAPAAPRPAGETLYTVKKGETLWAIARDQLGDPRQVATIKELNKDSLRGGDTVREGQKLRLPAKPSIASAAARATG